MTARARLAGGLIGVAILGPTVGCEDRREGAELTTQELTALAQREDGTVLTYGMADNYGGYRGLFQLFEETYDIRHLDIDMSSSAVMTRLTEERDDPRADAAVTGYLYGDAAVEQELLDCVPSSAVHDLPAWASGPADADCRSWVASFSGTLGFMVNTEVVDSPPRAWADLRREELAGRITFVDPRAAATGVATLLGATLALGGDIEHPGPGAELLADVALAGGPEVALTRQDYNGFVRGTRPIQVNYDYNLLQIRDTYGIECTFVYPKEGTVRVPYSTLLVRDRPHPYTGRLLMEFLLSPAGQARLARGYVTPILSDVPLAPEIQDLVRASGAEPRVFDVDWNAVGHAVEQMKATFARQMAPLEGRSP